MAAPDSILGAGAKKSPALFVVDAAGTVIGWTAPAGELTGYRSEEIVGRSGRLLLMPGRSNLWSGRLHDKERWHGLAELRHRDGDRLLVRVEGARLATRLAGHAWLLSAVPADEDLSGKTGSLLESLINSFPVAMAIWDRELRCVWRNAEAERLTEGFPYYRTGQSMADQIPGRDNGTLLEVMRRVLKDGVPVIDRESRWTSADHNEERMLSTSISRLDGVDGRPLGVCTLVLDVTDSRARDRLHLLREASIRVGTTLDVRRTAQELADLAVPALADFVSVDLGESVLPDTLPMQRLATRARVPAFRRAGLASVHEGIPEARWALNDVVFIRPPSPFSDVVVTGETHFEPFIDFSPGTWIDRDVERARLMRATGMHTMLIVPLKARGDVLGVTVFARTDNPRPFTRDDLMLAEELAARAALSLDNARRYTRERTTALALQRDLLPRGLSGGESVEVASRYLPSDVHDGVGGDWFDVIRLPDGRVALVVGDVTGHGINAAATMGRMRTAVRTLAYVGLRPHEVLTHLDRLIVRLSDEEDDSPHDPTGATCLYAVYDPATRRCVMSTAGHPPPALLLPSGEVCFPRIPSGTPIGVGLGAFESLELELEPGTVLALYTDGLIETRSSDLDVGMRRLGDALIRATQARVTPLERLCESVISSVLGDTPAEDDIALLTARTR
ncbi:SpoIIE family protein phosphatase [Nonomuraea sp. NPDC004580]|uniref:SpoIIE family protein phosphatase n=1 Tax=Nonomuraea sp. NPDC004580 TaxID=3154552 RepID=UPI0033A5C660